MASPLYDPREHAEEMKVPIIRHTLDGIYGAWIPGKRVILLSRTIPAELEVPVLAHECDHAEHDDPAGHHPKYETRANLHAALRLIDEDEFEVLTTMYADYDRICLELGITREQFLAYRDYRSRIIEESTRIERIGEAVYVEPKMGAGQWAMKFEVA